MKLIKNFVLTAAMVLTFIFSSKAFRFYETHRSAEVTVKWYDYLSIDARIAIKFPGVYEEKKQETANGTLISVKCIRDDDQFMFSANVHVIPFPDPFATIKLIMDNNIRNKGATLVKETDYFYKSYKGKSAVFKDMSGTYFYHGLIINNIIYQMLVYTSKEDIMDDVLSFFNSFDYKGAKK